MRRIVHYYPDAMGNSGVTAALWSWARAQAEAGAEVCVLSAPTVVMTSQVEFVPKHLVAGLSTRTVPHAGRRRLTRLPVGLDRFLGRRDLLVLHEGWVPSNLVAAAAARRAGVPYLVMPHGVYERTSMEYLKPPRWLRDRLERRAIEGAAAIHVFFESEVAHVTSLAPRAKFIVVPTGFDVPRERWIGGGGYLAWLGRIDPVHKGLDVLVNAIAMCPPERRPTVRIRGYDYKRGIDRLRRLIQERGVGAAVRLEPPSGGEEKMQFLQQADGYIHPSRWESHSIALLENLALGVPCIVSSTIHIAPTLAHDHAALLTEPREPRLAAAFERFERERQSIAPRGRTLIRDRFNWPALIARYHSTLAQMGLD